MLRPFLCTLALVLVATSVQAFEAGKAAFTKKQSTPLLSAPQRDAAPTGTALPFGSKVKVTAVQGVWIQVNANGKSGWVFNGNLSEDEPPKENKSTLTTTAADTTAATAARPLSQIAKDYAGRTSQSSAVGDIEWMERASDAVTSSAVKAYMKQNGKGEYSK